MASSEFTLPVEQWLQVFEKVSPKDLCNVILSSDHMNSMASKQDLWAKTKVNKELAMRNGLTPLFIIDRFKKIKEIDVSSMGNWVTPNMLKNLMNDIQESPLEKVDFHVTSLRGAPAEPLAQAVSHLKAVNLGSTLLTTLQSTKVLETSLSSNSLEKVNLACVSLDRVPSNLLAWAVSRLKTVNLTDTQLTDEQATELMEAIISSTTLEVVNLAQVNLGGVPSGLLARAVSRLQKVSLTGTRLRAQQATALMEASISSTSLVDVDMAFVDLSGVPPEQLARAVGRLQCVYLLFTEMTRDQCIAVGQAVLASTSLRQADLRGNQIQQNLPTQLFNSLNLMEYVQTWSGATSFIKKD